MKNYPHEYYHDLITQKSWEELINLKKLADFVLIGGWATYLYTRALKSKDIDIAINYDQLPILSKSYRLIKNYIQKYKLEKSTAYFINLLNELSSIDELSLNKHNFKKVKNELSKMLD